MKVLKGHNAAMVTYCVANMIKMCSPMVGQFLLYHDCSIEGLRVAKTTHQNLSAGNCFEQTSIRYLDSFTTSRRSRRYDSEIRQLSILHKPTCHRGVVGVFATVLLMLMFMSHLFQGVNAVLHIWHFHITTYLTKLCVFW